MQANQQGTFYKSISIQRNSESFSNTILKTEFLKKTENYTCVVQEFVTNITPPLNLTGEICFQIFVKGGAASPVANATFPAHWRIGDTQFKPTTYHGTIEFLLQAQHFFHKFGFLCRKLGANQIVGTLNTPQLRAAGYSFFKDHHTGGWDALPDKGRLVTVRMMSDGVFQVKMTAEFANNFYIGVGTDTRRVLGFDQHLYVVRLADLSYSKTAPLFDANDATRFAADDIDRDIVAPFIFFNSKNAMHTLDERLSLDIVATLPHSNLITAENGKPEHEYLLARFPINDYTRFETTLQSSQDRVLNKTTVTEDVNVGLEDLTRKSPASSAIHMLPGTIQEIDFQLWTRYFTDGKVVRYKTNMGDGFWALRLLFGKKV